MGKIRGILVVGNGRKVMNYRAGSEGGLEFLG